MAGFGIDPTILGSPWPAVRVVSASRICHDWRLRAHAVLPRQSVLERVCQRIARDLEAVFRSAYAGIDEALMVASLPSIRPFRIDKLHCIVSVECGGREHTVGDVYLASQYGTLERLDAVFELDDIQGPPAERWFIIRLARKARAKAGATHRRVRRQRT